MVSHSKLYTRLDALESELKEKLIPHLTQAANGNNDLVFCAEGYNQSSELKHKADKTTEELISIGRQILSLKTKLNETSLGSIAERICWYCNKWGDVSNHHHNTAQALAKNFLDEIEKANKLN